MSMPAISEMLPEDAYALGLAVGRLERVEVRTRRRTVLPQLTFQILTLLGEGPMTTAQLRAAIPGVLDGSLRTRVSEMHRQGRIQCQRSALWKRAVWTIAEGENHDPH